MSTRVRYFLRCYMPTNILLDLIRTRRGLKWGFPAMILAVPYLLAAGLLRALTERGEPGWLNLLVLVCIWNAMKLTFIGPISLIVLIHLKGCEKIARRRVGREEQRVAIGNTGGRA